MRDVEKQAKAALSLKAELDRRMALPTDQWQDWKHGDLLAELQADLEKLATKLIV